MAEISLLANTERHPGRDFSALGLIHVHSNIQNALVLVQAHKYGHHKRARMWLLQPHTD